MKNTFRYIAAFAALVSGFAVYAQNLETGTYKEENHIAYAKSATINTDGSYTINLETFVTGAVTQTFEVHPADIVLVLDVSGSMDGSINDYEYSTASVSSLDGSVLRHSSMWGTYYDDEAETDYFIKQGDNYYRVSIGHASSGGYYATNYFFLFFTVNGTTKYINSSGQIVDNRPTNVTNYQTNLLHSSVQLYTRTIVSSTKKIDALKTAVKSFINQIAHNDLYEDDTDSKPRENPLGNRIAIVKFGLGTYNGSTTFNANTHLTPGNHFASLATNWQGQWTGGYDDFTTVYDDGNNYNVTEIIAGFTPTAAATDVTSLRNTIDGLHAAGATAADMGMKLAYELVNRIGDDGVDRSDSRKTVVFFTDGEPTHGSEYDTTVASNAITNSNSIKSIKYTETYTEDGEEKTREVHPTVFSVGLFSDEVDSRVDGFMTSVASSSDNYMDASGGTAEDLKKIFDAIAHSAGGSANTDVSGSSSLTVDVVSSSFSVPTGFDQASDVITVKVAPCTGTTTIGNKTYLTFGQAKDPSFYGLDAITPNVIEAENKVTTTGFDYSANWCGPDPTTHNDYQDGYHGFKQIIEFVITVKDDAVGGPAVETNNPNSGIFLDGATEPLIKFNRPTVKLPVQIWIQKQGLKGDESAVFNLRRIAYRGTYETDPNTGEYILDADGNPIRIDYSAIPKSQWDTFTKVVINNEDMDDNGMVKIVGLDPDYVYRLDEDAWAFGYTYQDGGIQYTIGDNIENPFIFINIPENKKFDEASARNIFNERTTQ